MLLRLFIVLLALLLPSLPSRADTTAIGNTVPIEMELTGIR